MPCMCGYEPREDDKKKFKRLCKSLVDFINEMEKAGDPDYISIGHAKQLIDHLYTGKCEQK